MNLRINFLNWRPDIEPLGNDGLITADNVIHEPEGYKPARLQTAGAFATTGGLATASSVVTRPVGSQDDTFSAWLSGAPQTLHVGINGVTATTASTGYPLSFSTTVSSAAITFFDVCEIEDTVFFVATAEGNASAPATALSISVRGYLSL